MRFVPTCHSCLAPLAHALTCIVAAGCHSAEAPAADTCTETIAIFCDAHPCVTQPQAGQSITEAYCDDPRLASCVTGIAGCGPFGGEGSPPNDHGPYFTQVELYGCNPLMVAYHDPDSGALLMLASSFVDAGCIAGETQRGAFICQGVGLQCSADAAKPNDAGTE
jgi:hypothetical protein